MRKTLLLFISSIILILFAACGNSENTNDSDELPSLEVDFIVPESVDVGESVQLKAVVTYGDETEKDALVKFEVWETGDRDNSDMIEAENNGDGTYTTNYTFDQDGIFEMYAHTDAQNLHTMPKREITVGKGGEYDDEHEDEDHKHEFHTEGFDLHFIVPENVTSSEGTELTVHLKRDEDALENARVRYEVWEDGQKEIVAWIDAEEVNPGEYTTHHIFEKVGTYHIQIHVEDGEDLHEHVIYEVEVN